MVHRRKISTTEVRGNKRFFYTQSGVGFWFWPLFGKMIAAPPGSGTFREKIFIWANSVIIHSLKNMFKVPGGIRWQFFPVQMRSECGKLCHKTGIDIFAELWALPHGSLCTLIPVSVNLPRSNPFLFPVFYWDYWRFENSHFIQVSHVSQTKRTCRLWSQTW